MARFYQKKSPARVVGIRNAKPMTMEQESLFDRHQYVIGLLMKKFRLKFRACGIEYDDAKQVAMCGLWRAASVYDIGRQSAFFSLAYHCVMIALHELAEVKKREIGRLKVAAFSNITDYIDDLLVDRAEMPAEPFWIDDIDPKYAAIVRRRLAGVSWDEVAREFGYRHADNAKVSVKAAYNKVMRKENQCQPKSNPSHVVVDVAK